MHRHPTPGPHGRSIDGYPLLASIHDAQAEAELRWLEGEQEPAVAQPNPRSLLGQNGGLAHG